MIMVKVEPVQATCDAVFGQLEKMGKEGYAREIMQNAIRETAKQAAGRLPKETRKMYTIKQKDFNNSDVKISRVTRKRMEAILTVKGEVKSLWEYRSRKNGKRKGASAMVRKDGSMKELVNTYGGRKYKAFFNTIVNSGSGGNKSDYNGIFQRVPGKFMKTDKRPKPTKRIPKKKRKPKEAIEALLSLSRTKAAEIAFREKMYTDTSGELIYRLQKRMNAVIGER